MADAPKTSGPPKFKPLKRTSIAYEPKIAPSEAEVTEDFSKIREIAFIGQPPEPLPTIAPVSLQKEREGEIAAIQEQIKYPVKPTKSVVTKQKEVSTKVTDEEAEAEATEAEAKPEFFELVKHVKDKISSGNDTITPPLFVPENRRAFKPFLITTFKKYLLPPPSTDPDPEVCQKAAKASSKELKTFQYQALVRDYLQRASPYRGLLVYHGLGSGKTCTSIATAEALYGAGNRRIFVMTPASLSGNFRGEMTKCGYFAFQQENHWTFVPATIKSSGPELTFLIETLGLPIDWVRKIKGGWVPDPTLPSNWKELDAATQAVISEQIKRHVASRFKFINYNGLSENTVREWACKTPRMFDGAVIIIDEVHNLIRTINNSNLEAFYKNEPLEPEYRAKYCQTGQKYRISYLVYRLLCNAVGAKIVALSGTPIINYPQELGIMANILSGDMRYASITLPSSVDVDKVKEILIRHPEVDLFDVVRGDGVVAVKLTPVPSGHRKVVSDLKNEKGEIKPQMRGFVRDEDLAAENPEINRERDLPAWLSRVESEIKTQLQTSFANPTFGVHQRLPDIEKPFLDTFINTETLTLQEPNNKVLMARLSGLISYYKAGKPELVARVVRDEIVEIEMSDTQLQQYTVVRNEEIKQEEDEMKRRKKKVPAKDARYEEIMKSQKGTFKIFSRAACNFVFPSDIPRPRPSDVNFDKTDLGTHKEEKDVISEEIHDDEESVTDVHVSVADPYIAAIQNTIISLRQRGNEFFNKEALQIYSPKFQKIIDNLEGSVGPALIYSNFKTLEGLGLFGISLEFQKNYIRLDIKQEGGEWQLLPELLYPENLAKKRYITYTGDDLADKRDLLKHIFNANWAKLPVGLAAQIKQINGNVNDNIKGQISQLFMITQSGAEGISLENVRQVHIMEPYWNYVRLEQVKGRAIRICSHKSLPYEDRTVEVFTYISKFSEKQVASRQVDQTLLIKDKGLSTDQQILSVSDGKRKLTESLFNAMKSAAVDCELNSNENGGYACYRFPDASMIPLFNPKLEEDIRESAASTRTKTTK